MWILISWLLRSQPIWIYTVFKTGYIWAQFVLIEVLHPSTAMVMLRQFFSHVRMGLPGLNQYQAADEVSCAKTQHSDSADGEARTSNPSISSLRLYQLSHCTYLQNVLSAGSWEKKMITVFPMTMRPINNPWDAIDKALCMLSTVQYLYSTPHHYNTDLNIMVMLCHISKWFCRHFNR